MEFLDKIPTIYGAVVVIVLLGVTYVTFAKTQLWPKLNSCLFRGFTAIKGVQSNKF